MSIKNSNEWFISNYLSKKVVNFYWAIWLNDHLHKYSSIYFKKKLKSN